MATGFHESTVGFSVRNFLAINGKAQVPQIVTKLQELWIAEVDEAEVTLALTELVARRYVRALDGGFFEATVSKVFQSRSRPSYLELERDPMAWQGWH
jgi:hypothetical protein